MYAVRLYHHVPIFIRPEHPRPDGREPVDRLFGRMAIAVLPDFDDGEGGTNGFKEFCRTAGFAPMMGDFEDVN
jgi:hypothetical protein